MLATKMVLYLDAGTGIGGRAGAISCGCFSLMGQIRVVFVEDGPDNQRLITPGCVPAACSVQTAEDCAECPG